MPCSSSSCRRSRPAIADARCRRPSPPLPPLPIQPAVSAPPRRSRPAGAAPARQVSLPDPRCPSPDPIRWVPPSLAPGGHASLVPHPASRSEGRGLGTSRRRMAAAVVVDAAGSCATCRWVLTTTAGYMFFLHYLRVAISYGWICLSFGSLSLRPLFLPPSAVGTSYGELHCCGGVDFPKQGAVRQGHVATCKKPASASQMLARAWARWSTGATRAPRRRAVPPRVSCAILRDGKAEHRLPDSDKR